MPAKLPLEEKKRRAQERSRSYYVSHKLEIRAKSLAWRSAHKDVVAERNRLSHAKNRTARLAAKRLAYAADRERYRAIAREYARTSRCKVNRARRQRGRTLAGAEMNLWRGARTRSAKKGWGFTLRREDVRIPERCPVLGVPFLRDGIVVNSPSLDRVDNSIGYTRENVRVVSLRANKLKSDATSMEARSIAQYMENSQVNIAGMSEYGWL